MSSTLGQVAALLTMLTSVASGLIAGEPGRYVGTPSDPWIPNFGHPEVAAGPRLESVQSGVWSDPETWGGVRPDAADVVIVRHGVLFDVQTTVRDVVVYPTGRLRFRPDRDTRLAVGTLQVLVGGELEIGRPTQPIAATSRAEVVFADRAIDTAVDPGQYGHGLLVLGRARLHGAPIETNFVRLAAEPGAGDVSIELAEAIAGWRVGARVVVADSRQTDPRIDRGFQSQTEVVEIAGFSPQSRSQSRNRSRSLILAEPLRYAHFGARGADGELDLLPHVAYLSSNVVLRSANRDGSRGHAQFLHRADADVRYVLFQDLGRTTAEALDPTLFDEEGNALHVGTNQPGRYPVHAHHLNGPETTPPNGYQFTFVGNAIDGGPEEHLFKWGIAVHAAHYGLVRGNTVYNYAGSGIVTEDGSESYNRFDHNYVARCSAFGSLNTQDRGTAGTAFWFRGQNNFVRRNVAADARASGFSINAYRLGEVTVPVAPGSLDRRTVDMNALPILDFTDNESYGPAFHGLDLWEIGSTGETLHDVPRSFVRDLRIWHHYDRGLIVYRTHRITYDRLTIRGDIPQLDSRYVDPVGVDLFDFYRLRSHALTRADIQGQRVGVAVDFAAVPEDLVGPLFDLPAPQDRVADVLIQASTLRNYVNLSVETRRNLGSPRRTIVCDSDFGRVDVDPDGQNGPQLDVTRDYDFGLDRNVVSPDEVVVFDYDLDPVLDLDLFYLEQAPDFVVPKTSDDGRRIGSPVEGLTNEENWQQFGIAIGGEIAACLDDVTHPKVDGFACALDDAVPTSPAVLTADLSDACSGEIRLSWAPACDDRGVTGYTVTRDGRDLTTTSLRRYVDGGLTAGSYRYRVRSMDAAGHESIPSTAAVVEVPEAPCLGDEKSRASLRRGALR